MNMKEELVTIAIPTYKVGFLKQAIYSALGQTYKNLEVIVVDDKSPYDIKSVVNEFHDNRLFYYRNEENLGAKDPAGNWNKSLSLAHGAYFALLCDDDLYDPNFIETMVSMADKHPNANVFRARCAIVDKNGTTTEMYPSSPLWETSEDYMWHVFKGLRRQTISEFLYRTEHIRKLGGYARLPFAWNADYISLFRFSKEGGIISTSSILVKFRMSGENISSRANEHGLEKMQANVDALRFSKELIKESGCEYVHLLEKECMVWKYHLDRNLLSSLGLKEAAGIFFKRNKFGVGAGVFFKSAILALLNYMNKGK